MHARVLLRFSIAHITNNPFFLANLFFVLFLSGYAFTPFPFNVINRIFFSVTNIPRERDIFDAAAPQTKKKKQA